MYTAPAADEVQLSERVRVCLTLLMLNCWLSMMLTLNLLTTTIVAPSSNAGKWQMGFNSAFKGLMC